MHCVSVLVAQLCPTLCDSMDCSLPSPSVHGLLQARIRERKSESESCSVVSDSLWPHGLYSPWNSPDQNTGVGSRSSLQWIFPTQGWNPALLHCRILAAAAAKSHQSCLTLRDPMDCSPPGSSVHGIFQARVLEWGAISSRILEWAAILYSRWSSWPRDGNRVSCLAGGFFTVWATREAPLLYEAFGNSEPRSFVFSYRCIILVTKII